MYVLRVPLLCLGMLAVTWLEFSVFPGHTYLQSGTQVYVPVLERLNTPGYLSRDLLSETPDIVSYTIYDEITLSLHGTGRVLIRTALVGQQFLFRFAAVVGVFLLARSTGLSDLFAVLVTALVNLGATLVGPSACLTNPEPVPAVFAAGLTILAMGLFASDKALLAGIAAGLAFCYDPVIAAPFWAVMILAFAADRELRKVIRPMLPILLIFVLLLANLAQLQPGVMAAGQSPFSKIAPQVALLQQLRTPYVWVSVWAGTQIWHYLTIAVLGVWAATRIWPVLNRRVRWLAFGIGVVGPLSVACSYVLLDWLKYAILAEFQPSRTLIFTVAIAALLFGLAGMRAIVLRRYWEAFAWFILAMALPVNASVLELPRQPGNLALCLLLAGALTLLLALFRATRWRFAALLAPVAAMFALAWLQARNSSAQTDSSQVHELSAWAARNTWGSSMFLFPDAAKGVVPGVFRAESLRAVWSDWKSGVAVDYSEAGAVEWQARWSATMDGSFSPARLQTLLPLPIDYYVLKRANQIAGVRAVFTDEVFTVYDAQDLRNVRGVLELAP